MNNIKVITIFSLGDPRDAKTWSNVPHFLIRELERNNNLVVNAINIKPNKFLSGFWNKFILKIIRLFLKRSTVTFERTPFFHIIVQRKIKKIVKKYQDTDLFISTSFSYHPEKVSKNQKVALFCDWTYEYYLQFFLNKKIDFFEKYEILNQLKMIESSDITIVLFPDVNNYMNEKYFGSNIRYIGNVVNSEPYQINDLTIQKKYKEKNVLFIGGPKYISGLICLIESLNEININFGVLYIIGISESLLKTKYKKKLLFRVFFLGYLDKSVSSQKKIYYNIVNKSYIIVNTTPKWSSFSATLDAMYHGTPPIVSAYRSFIETFGQEINFGIYSENRVDSLKRDLNSMFTLTFDEYKEKAVASTIVTSNFTWEKFTKNFLNTVEKC